MVCGQVDAFDRSDDTALLTAALEVSLMTTTLVCLRALFLLVPRNGTALWLSSLAQDPSRLSQSSLVSGQGDVEMVRLLLKHGADPLLYKHFKQQAPLLQAVASGEMEVVKAMLEDWAGEWGRSRSNICHCSYRRNGPAAHRGSRWAPVSDW